MTATPRQSPPVPRVGLLMEAARNYERGLLRGIARYAQLHGPWQFLRPLPAVAGGGAVKRGELHSWQPDGLIVREAPAHRHALALGIPTLYAPSTRPLPGIANIVVDDHAVGALAARHLMECGLRQFAFCGMDARYFWSRRRRDGFVAMLQQGGFGAHIYESGLADAAIAWSRDLPRLRDWIAALPAPIGLMVCTDDFSLLAAEACKAAGRRIPEDIALVGVGNDESLCELTLIALSSVILNTEAAGFAAAAELHRLMRHPRGPAEDVVVAPAGVAHRPSTDVLPVADEHVRAAVRFIRERAGQPLHVDDVVAAIPLSRRTLYSRFEAAMGQPIYRYIQQARVDRFARLLAESPAPVGRIAEALGFPDEKNVSRLFRRLRGITPLAFRRRMAGGV